MAATIQRMDIFIIKPQSGPTTASVTYKAQDGERRYAGQLNLTLDQETLDAVEQAAQATIQTHIEG